jgi:hypothetical protein
MWDMLLLPLPPIKGFKPIHLFLKKYLKTNSFVKIIDMKLSRAIFVFLLLLLSVSFGCDDPSGVNSTDSQNSDAIQDPYAKFQRLTENQTEALEKDLDLFFELLTEKDFEGHLAKMHDGIWESDTSLVYNAGILEKYHDMGFVNLVDETSLNYVSPIVLDTASGNEIVLAELQTKMRILVTEEAAPNGLGIEGMIRTRYGEGNYQWVEEDRMYYIDAPSKMYAFVGEDHETFSYINEQFIQSPRLSGLLNFNTVRALKKMEKDRP